MSFKRCPGSMAFAQPKIELVRCRHCGNDVEVWTDEAEGKCPSCGGTVCRTTTQSCIDWCKYARECLGDEGHKKYQDMKSQLRKETLLKAAEQHWVDEREGRVTRARVEFSEQLLRREAAADPNVVLAAAALANVSGPDAAPDAAPGAAPAPAAAGILQELGYPEGFVKEVDDILRHLQAPGQVDSVNFRVVQEADRLARAAEARVSS